MPNKTFYIRDEHVALFEKALNMGGDNLSSTIAEALKRFVETKEAEAGGMKEIVLLCGRWTSKDEDEKKVKFTGRLLASDEQYTGQTSSRDDRGIDWEIYQTKKGRFLVWWKLWSRWDGEGNVADYEIYDELPEFDAYPFGKLDTEPGEIPGQIISIAAEKTGRESVENLDI